MSSLEATYFVFRMYSMNKSVELIFSVNKIMNAMNMLNVKILMVVTFVHVPLSVMLMVTTVKACIQKYLLTKCVGFWKFHNE